MRAPVLIAAVALAAALLIACGGSDAAPAAPSQPESTATEAATSAPAATATEAPTTAPAAAAETPAAAVAALPRVYFIHTEW